LIPKVLSVRKWNDHKKDCKPWVLCHRWLIWLWSHPNKFLNFNGWKSFKVYHSRWKKPNLYCNFFLPYVLIPKKIMNQKLSKFQKDYILDNYNFRFHHNHSKMCLYMIKKTRKKDRKRWCYDKILVHLKKFAP